MVDKATIPFVAKEVALPFSIAEKYQENNGTDTIKTVVNVVSVGEVSVFSGFVL